MVGVMPLDDVTVIDLTQGEAGPFATRLLSDYGANVIKIEPPEGDPARMQPPFHQDEPGPERSAVFLFLNTNKRSVVLDLERAEDRDRLLGLVAGADVVVESFPPGTMERLGLGYQALREANPRIVLTSMTNFGQDGPYRDYQVTDLTLYAMGGPMIASGDVDHEPLKNAGHMTLYHAGIVGALATSLALRAAEGRGEGEHVDLSLLETATHSIDLRLARLMMYQYTGSYGTRPPLASAVGSGTFPCGDGFYMLSGGPVRLEGVIRMIGQPELLEQPEWATIQGRAQPERIDQFNQYLIPWMISHTKAEITQACIEHGVLGGPINTVADMLEDANFRHRGFFQEIDHPETGPLAYPGYSALLRRPDEPMPPRRRAPLLGEHTEEVLAEAAPAPREAPTVPPAGATGRLPLEGVRILDFTVVLAGPYSTMHLAEWGAEVIRVETLQHFANATRGLMARPSPEIVAAQMLSTAGLGYPNGEAGERPWNRSSAFNHHSRNKLSMTVDLSRPEGQEVFERLVTTSDGLIENNLPQNIERLDINWERLSAINPRFIMLRMPGYGVEGPYRNLRSMGMHMEAFSGHPAIRSYPGLSLEYIPLGVPSDAAGGAGAAFSFSMGLRYRDRTGRGLLIEQATTENFVPLIGEFVLDYSMNGRIWDQMGNNDVWMAPHNAYPCQGLDRWVAIAVRSEEEWRRLCESMRREDLVDDPRFADMAARLANRAELDAIVTEWTSPRDRYWIMHRLQRVGVPAAPVMTEADAYEDRHHEARGFFREVPHPETDTYRQVGRAWRAGATLDPQPRHAPLLGQDNEYVYKELLGFSDAEYRRFEELGHIGDDYDPSVP